MNTFTLIALFCFAIGIHSSVSIPAGMHLFGFISGLYYAIKDKSIWKRLPLSSWALVVFIAVFLASGIINFSQMSETSKSLGSVKYWLFGILFIFSILHFPIPEKTKHIRIMVNLLLVSVILAGIIGIIRSKWQIDPLSFKSRSYHERNGGFYGYMRYAYNLQFLLIFMTSLLFLKEKLKDFFNSKILITAYVIGWIGMFASQTRGALLGTIFGILVLVFLINKKIGLILGGGILIILLGALAVIFNGGSQKIRVLERFNSSSNTMRLSQYHSALYAFKEKPFFGHGPLQLRHEVQRIKASNNLEHKEYVGQHAHNIFLEHLADYGVIGLLFFTLWLILWGTELFTSSWMNKFIILPCYAAIWISGQVEYLFNSTGSFTIMLLYSISIASYLREKFKE
jgi:O-antigen ligase